MAQINPIQSSKERLDKYTFNQKLFLGQHFDAFRMKTTQFGKDYDNLRYVMANFAGMLSKLSADMLFQEFPRIHLADDTAQEWLEKVMRDNNFQTQLYESGMQNSYRGDAVFRVRSEVIDASKAASRIIVEDVTPEIYFPVYDTSNARKEPKQKVLAWEVTLNEAEKTKGVFMEIHEKGKIINELWQIGDGGQLTTKLDVKTLYKDMPDEIATNIDDFLVVHVKNYGIGTMPFGISDYEDLTPIFYAINNRITRIDNILDKHGDPILAVPEGVLDAEGKVRKESFGVIEIPGNEKEATPQYIVWDAKLESAFSEIEQLVQFLYMVSGTSASAFGMGAKDGQGQAESGRALKFKMLRTIANKARKELYYDDGLKRLLTIAQKFAIANKLQTSDGTTLKGEAMQPEIEWSDGILNDRVEDVEVEEKRINMGTSSAQQSIIRLDSVSEEEAAERVKEITDEQKAMIPEFVAKPITMNKDGKPTD